MAKNNMRMYIGGLLYQVQPEEIYEMFEREDISITNLDMSIDPFSGRNPSYCFVDLGPGEDGEAVIRRLGGYKIRGGPIKINYDAGKRSRGPQRTETRLRKGEWQRFDSVRKTDSPMVFDRYARRDARDHWTKPVEEGRRLYVGGLRDHCNQDVVNEEMRRLFSDFNIQAVSKRVLHVKAVQWTVPRAVATVL